MPAGSGVRQPAPRLSAASASASVSAKTGRIWHHRSRVCIMITPPNATRNAPRGPRFYGFRLREVNRPLGRRGLGARRPAPVRTRFTIHGQARRSRQSCFSVQARPRPRLSDPIRRRRPGPPAPAAVSSSAGLRTATAIVACCAHRDRDTILLPDSTPGSRLRKSLYGENETWRVGGVVDPHPGLHFGRADIAGVVSDWRVQSRSRWV